MPQIPTRACRRLRRPAARRRGVRSTSGRPETATLLGVVIVSGAVVWARRQRRRRSLAGPGNEQPAGYENPAI
ncbi:hypothetical protein [Mycolicibacterium obuense]|uniref:hypothetical protein n=1 Tax=Mycolicibacterium obuense TaxID=1807 RepID=UPI0014074914|nr:hypothetical protein [Mycolicibacterium obuense]